MMDEGYCVHCKSKTYIDGGRKEKVFNPRVGDVEMLKGTCPKCKKGISKIIKNHHVKVGKGEKRVPNRADTSHYPVELKKQ